ncbi:tyrosine-type recombinase/integrase, partial [Staphylococcus capitis]|uniref:tyrosine-type recombinase/integrase n=1 Tax=Staphylococcus capitis TaxID=29388 RepID=UPI00119DF44E
MPVVTPILQQIPILQQLYQPFNPLLPNPKPPKSLHIHPYTHFLFLNTNHYPKTSHHYYSIFKHLLNNYNKYHQQKLPHITPHIFPHTFSTNYPNPPINPKPLHYIIGHPN